MKKIYLLIILLTITFICFAEKHPLGSKNNPLKMYFVPSMEAGKVINQADAMAEMLQQKTGLYFKTAVPTSYAAVVEALGTDEADIAWLATFAYILAHDINGAEVGLTTIRNGLENYKGQFITRNDSGINKLTDIKGKIVAYTDAASTSGFIYPSAILKQINVVPKRYVFAGGHTQAIIAVLEGNADVACTFWSPEHNGDPQDARKYVLETYPDVFKKTKIIGYTDWIPNDTVTFRKELPSEMKSKIINAIMEIATTTKGKQILKELYAIDGFKKAKDSDYDVVRKALDALGMSSKELVK